jgi:hypothetical protein
VEWYETYAGPLRASTDCAMCRQYRPEPARSVRRGLGAPEDELRLLHVSARFGRPSQVVEGFARSYRAAAVSLHLFRSICFAQWVSPLSATGPPPRPLVLRWLRAWALGGRGVRRFAPEPPFLDPPCRSGWFCAQAWRCVWRGGAVARWSGVRQVRQAGEFTGSEQLSLVRAWLVGWAVSSEVVCRR